jgi:hypothetical protein
MRNLYNQNLARRAKCCARKVWIRILWPVFVGSVASLITAVILSVNRTNSTNRTLFSVEQPYDAYFWIGTDDPNQPPPLYGVGWQVQESQRPIPPNQIWEPKELIPERPIYYQVPELASSSSTTARDLAIISASLAAISGALLLYQVVRNR